MSHVNCFKDIENSDSCSNDDYDDEGFDITEHNFQQRINNVSLHNKRASKGQKTLVNYNTKKIQLKMDEDYMEETNASYSWLDYLKSLNVNPYKHLFLSNAHHVLFGQF